MCCHSLPFNKAPTKKTVRIKVFFIQIANYYAVGTEMEKILRSLGK